MEYKFRFVKAKVEFHFRFSRACGKLGVQREQGQPEIRDAEQDGMDEAKMGVRRERKDVRRNMERVLQAAHELFAERGTAVTMEEVAQRAGVGVGTVYRRFPSKEHLFAAVSHAACKDTHHCLAEAAQGGRDPVDKLRSIVVVHYRRSAQQAPLFDLHSGYVSGRQACHAQSEPQQLYESLHNLLHEVIGEGQRQGLLRDGDPAILACLCLELLHPRAFQNLQRMLQCDVDEIAEHVVTFMVRGLAGERSPRRHGDTETERERTD